MNRKKQNVTIVGAGSTRTPALIGSLINFKERFPLKKLTLFDISKDRIDVQRDYIQLMMEKYYPEAELVFTDDEDQAYIDVDFVFVQMRVGNFEMRSLDEKSPQIWFSRPRNLWSWWFRLWNEINWPND